MLSSMPDYINDLREVQHYLLKQADYHQDYASDDVDYFGISVGYRNAYHRITELIETWEKQTA